MVRQAQAHDFIRSFSSILMPEPLDSLNCRRVAKGCQIWCCCRRIKGATAGRSAARVAQELLRSGYHPFPTGTAAKDHSVVILRQRRLSNHHHLEDSGRCFRLLSCCSGLESHDAGQSALAQARAEAWQDAVPFGDLPALVSCTEARGKP